jgi:hypothetical protein
MRAPDVSLVDQPDYREAPIAATAPATVVLPAVRRRGNRFVQILDSVDRRVVTAIEVLSPANKEAGPDREAYLAKRKEYFAAGVSLVELDLLRGGGRLPLGNPPRRAFDYYVLVCRAWELPQAGFWPLGVRDPVPDVPIPIEPHVRPVLLPLRACMDQVYDGGRYAIQLPYHQPPTPRLRRADAAWARQVLETFRPYPEEEEPTP